MVAQAEQRLRSLSMRAAKTGESAVACLRIDLYLALDRASSRHRVGLDYLRHLGIDFRCIRRRPMLDANTIGSGPGWAVARSKI